MINSSNNEKVKYYKKLRTNKYIKEYKKFIVEGEHLVQEALKADVVEEIIALENTSFKTNKPVTYVSSSVLKKISTLDSTPNIMAVCKIEENNEIIGNKILLLDKVGDPGNGGTIIRSASAFNMDSVVFSKDSVNIYNDKLIRATQGMFFHTNIITSDLKEVILSLKKQGYTIIGSCLNNSIDLKELEKTDKYALIVGNEGSGISKEILELCDKLVKIHMNEKCESLNVSVASAILMYYMEG